MEYTNISRTHARLYNTVHKHNLRVFAKSGTCEDCGSVARTHWSNKSGLYFIQRADWQELCAACHATYDKKLRKTMAKAYPTIARVLTAWLLVYGDLLYEVMALRLRRLI